MRQRKILPSLISIHGCKINETGVPYKPVEADGARLGKEAGVYFHTEMRCRADGRFSSTSAVLVAIAFVSGAKFQRRGYWCAMYARKGNSPDSRVVWRPPRERQRRGLERENVAGVLWDWDKAAEIR